MRERVKRAGWRTVQRRVLGLLGLVLGVLPMMALQTTTVQGPVYRADGTAAKGTLLLSWPSFTASDGSAVAAGSTTITIGNDGSFTVSLTPNEGALPAGTYYTAVYHAPDGTVQKEYWVVPQSGPVTVGLIRASVVPAAVAQSWSNLSSMQTTMLSSLQTSFLPLKGGSLTGSLLLPSDPSVPLQAATKAYVDAHAGANLPVNAIPYQGTPGSTPVAATADKIVATFHSMTTSTGTGSTVIIGTTFTEKPSGNLLDNTKPSTDLPNAAWYRVGGNNTAAYTNPGASFPNQSIYEIDPGQQPTEVQFNNITLASTDGGVTEFYTNLNPGGGLSSAIGFDINPSAHTLIIHDFSSSGTGTQTLATLTGINLTGSIDAHFSGQAITGTALGQSFSVTIPNGSSELLAANRLVGINPSASGILTVGGVNVYGIATVTTHPQVACNGVLQSDGTCGTVQPNQMLAADVNGHVFSLGEMLTVTNPLTGVASLLCEEDHDKGVFDVRCPRIERIDGNNTSVNSYTSPALAFQQMAFDMACWQRDHGGRHPSTTFPPGKFKVGLPQYPTLSYPAGAYIHGTAGGLIPATEFDATYINSTVFAVSFDTATVAYCQDGTATNFEQAGTGGEVTDINENGCTNGGCINLPGHTQAYGANAGPNQNGIYIGLGQGHSLRISAHNNGGYGVHYDGQDSHHEQAFVQNSLTWWRFDRRPYNVLPSPSAPTAAPSTTRGTLGAGTYYYKITAVSNGETLGSSEVSATTTGTTGSVALSWTAETLPEPNVIGAGLSYRIYRGSSAGGENVFFTSSTNSFTDTGAAGTAGTVPTTNTSGTYTPANDQIHGGLEFAVLDGTGERFETYGTFGYGPGNEVGHVCGVQVGGGTSTVSNIFEQIDEMGVCRPYGSGGHGRISDVRAEGNYGPDVLITDGNVNLAHLKMPQGCTSSYYVANNPFTPGKCSDLTLLNGGISVTDADIFNESTLGTSYRTSFIYNAGDNHFANVNHVNGADYADGNAGQAPGVTIGYPEADLAAPYGGTPVSGATPNLAGLNRIVMQNSSPTSVTGATGLMIGQPLHITLNDANTTLVSKANGGAWKMCSGNNVTGPTSGPLTFWVFDYGGNRTIAEECDSPNVVQSAETVGFSAAPVFSGATRASSIVLNGNVTGFTMPAGGDGQEKTLIFCQDATGGRTVAGPANVRGLMAVGSTAAKCSAQHFTYSVVQGAWLADGPGVVNE